jgi:hypothetical protein
MLCDDDAADSNAQIQSNTTWAEGLAKDPLGSFNNAGGTNQFEASSYKVT